MGANMSRAARRVNARSTDPDVASPGSGSPFTLRSPSPICMVPSLTRLLCVLSLGVAACARPAPEPAEPPVPARPLAVLVSQQVVVAPTQALRETDALGWTAQVPRSRELLRALDDSIRAELAARGIDKQWVFPEALERASKLNPTYSVNAYALDARDLGSPSMVAGERIPGALATQLRTIVALQESARAVLVPSELRFDRLPSGEGVAVLHVALVDARMGDIRWIGDVKSDPSPTFSRGLLSSLAAHLADLITAP